MIPLSQRVPELAQAIAAQALAVVAQDEEAAARFVTEPALEAYRSAMRGAARCGPFDRYEAPGLARLGDQYISKVRFSGVRGNALMQIRWKHGPDGQWRIADAEYFPAGSSPWTGVGRPKLMRRENADA